MQKLILSFVLMIVSSMAIAADDSPKEVQALIARGDYPAAEAMLRDAVSEHPKSAKAHYVLAEVLAHQGNIGEAKTEAAKAASLDPETHFTDPAKFQAFQHKLDAALAPVSNTRSATAPARLTESAPAADRASGGASHMTGWLIVIAIVALIAFLWSRRRRDTAGPYDTRSAAPPYDNTPPYGSFPNNGPYAGNGPYGAPQAQPHSGVGAAVAAGVGGLAAGVLLDEALRSHRDDDVTRDVVGSTVSDRDPSGQAYDDLRDDPIDMGNNDSSWDDSSSGDSGSSDDDSW
jgi:hypothetical protein